MNCRKLMKTTARLICVCLFLFILVLSFGGFQQAFAEEKFEDTLDRIKRTGVFNLGVREATYPYGYVDANNNYVGFSTDIARKVHERLEKELKRSIKLNYVVVTGRTRIPLLLNRRIDLEAGATVITKGRTKVVDFSVPFFTTATMIVVPKESPIRKLQDLAGKRVGIPSGGLEERMYRSFNDSGRINPSVKTIGYEDHPEGFQALITGAIDAYSSDGPILYAMRQKASDPGKWRIFDPKVNVFLQAFPMREQSSKFKNIVDHTIVELFESGKWQELFNKYFGPQSKSPYAMTEGLKFLKIMNSWPQ
ncbi:MAG: amino acid ABC transporter substrate-binding protein [Deltaproteobacteria bacterium]|nr:amino acid ABC transporter substrate-binding protein [Deltaproteobacteria bacterium]MBW1961869.1 amino acid ABC transporter substrate-binding protein [Deltaproteobacteria bacterium]MBW2152590.1 amino acid ABC transporter substrate-binding protein [Deltaproteobacteria bacterium]